MPRSVSVYHFYLAQLLLSDIVTVKILLRGLTYRERLRVKLQSIFYIHFTPRGQWMAAMMPKRRPRHHGHHSPQFEPSIRTNSKLSTIVIIDILEPVPIKVSDKLVSLTTRKGINIFDSKARILTLIPQEASQKTNSTL